MSRKPEPPRKLIHVIHETANWLGHLLKRLHAAGEEPPEGAEYIYQMLLRTESEQVGGIMHESGRREDE